MTWFAVWKTSNGELVSVGTVVASPLPAGLSTTDLGQDQPSGVWNNVTHTFDPAAVLKAVLTLKEFAQRFTVAEREALWDIQQNGTATQKKKLGAFRQYMTDAGSADLNDAYIVASVQLMEAGGVIAAGRAAVITA
jgi:hypothetical protein